MMKKYMMLLIVMTASLGAEEWYRDTAKTAGCYRSFTYVKIGAEILPGAEMGAVGPAISLGRRFEEGHIGCDLSLNYGSGVKGVFFATPKAAVLVIVDPEEDSTLYVGFGVSFGGLYHFNKHKRFIGIMGELVVGYDFCRNRDVKTFVELTVSQPAVPTDKKHAHVLPPALALSFGIGY